MLVHIYNLCRYHKVKLLVVFTGEARSATTTKFKFSFPKSNHSMKLKLKRSIGKPYGT